MAVLDNLIDGKGRIAYEALVDFVFSCPFGEFADQVKHPFIVGKELYDGALRTADGPQNSTMKFEAYIHDETTAIPAETGMETPEAEKRRHGIARAIFALRKKPYSYEKDANTITIGRGNDNDLVVVDYVISKHHAQVVVFNDKYFLTDVGSTNGTMINHKPVNPNLKVQIPLGAGISFGRVAFVFVPPLELYYGLRKDNF